MSFSLIPDAISLDKCFISIQNGFVVRQNLTKVSFEVTLYSHKRVDENDVIVEDKNNKKQP